MTTEDEANGGAFLRLCRSLHVYLGMAAVTAVLGFAVSGFVMNHKDSLGTEDTVTENRTGQLPRELLTEPISEANIVAELRSRFALAGIAHRMERDGADLRIAMKQPGRQTDVTIHLPTGVVSIVTERAGVLGVLADLHRGRQAGAAWKWIIDATAGAVALVCLTGLVLWCRQRSRRVVGILVAIAGAAACVATYLLCVP